MHSSWKFCSCSIKKYTFRLWYCAINQNVIGCQIHFGEKNGPMALDSQWLNWLMRRTKTLLFLQHRQPSTHIHSCFQSAQVSSLCGKYVTIWGRKTTSFARPWFLFSALFNKWHHRPPWWDPHHSWHGWSVCPRIVSPYPVRLKHSCKLQVFAVSLDNDLCVSAVLSYSFRMILKDQKTHMCSELSELTCGELSFYHFFAENPIWSNLLLTSSVQFDSLHKYDDVHLIF